MLWKGWSKLSSDFWQESLAWPDLVSPHYTSHFVDYNPGAIEIHAKVILWLLSITLVVM